MASKNGHGKTRRMAVQPDERPISVVGTARWKAAVPTHLQVPLAKALTAMEANDLPKAMSLFGECCNLCQNEEEIKPILFFGGQVAGQVWVGKKNEQPPSKHLGEWRGLTEMIIAGAAEMHPTDPVPLHNYGRFLDDEGEQVRAIAWYQKALQYDATQVESWGNLGTALYQQGAVDEAWKAWNNAIKLPADKASARLSQAYIWLRLGQYEQGWEAFHDRWKDLSFTSGYGRKDLDARAIHWNGEALPKRHSILLHGEQGLGDHVMFARYVPMLAERYNVVGLETRPILKRWMEASFPDVRILSRDVDRVEDYPTFTHHCSTMDLPFLLKTTVDTIPNSVAPQDPLGLKWRRILKGGEFRVGIAWEGAKGNSADYLRSIPAELLQQLAGIPGVTWVSLQFSPEAPMVARAYLNAVDGTAGCADTLDTAAVMRGMDLVVTVDTLSAHMAATLGIPTILLQRFCREWRWGDETVTGSNCLWYPSLTQYTQTAPGDWPDLLQRVRSHLATIGRRSSGGS